MKEFAKRAVAVVTMLALSVGLGFALVACGGSSAANDEKLIKDELAKVLDAFKNPTAESLAPYTTDADLKQLEAYGVDYVELFQHLFKHFDYTINDVKVDGDTAVAKLTVENADITKVMNDLSANMTSDEAFVNELMSAYSSGGEQAMYPLIFEKLYTAIDASTDIVKSDAELKLTKTNNQWDIDEDSMNDLVSKVYGGLDMSSLA